MEHKFYPNIEYNKKRRMKYYVLLAVLTVITLLMDAWFIGSKQYFGLAISVVLVLAFILLLPHTIKTNPVKKQAVITVDDQNITVMDKKISLADVTSVSAIVYLPSIGNLVENREFLEKTAADKPLLEMMGSFEVFYKNDKNAPPASAVIENVTEALLIFVKEGKVNYKLGYSLGKEYRASTYNLNEFIAEEQVRQKPKSAPVKGKVKDLL